MTMEYRVFIGDDSLSIVKHCVFAYRLAVLPPRLQKLVDISISMASGEGDETSEYESA